MKMRQIYVSVFNEGLWYTGDCTYKLYIYKMMSYPVLTSILKTLVCNLVCLRGREERLGLFSFTCNNSGIINRISFGSVG